MAPEIESAVSKASQASPYGSYRYRYVVTNKPRAAQPIRTWLLSVPMPAPRDPATASYQVLHDEEERGPWRQDHYAYRPAHWSIRFTNRSGSPLLPGQSAVFVVESDSRPGISKAYFHGVMTSIEPLPDGMPARVSDQLERLKRTQNWGNEIRWTIAPLYGETVSSQEIAADYRSRLTSLANHGILDRNSPFIRTVLDRLDAFIKKPRYWDGWDACCGFSLPVDEPFPPIGVPPDPRSRAEQQIDRALEMALVIRPLSDQRNSDPWYRAPDPQFRETTVIPLFREERSSIVLFQTVYKKDLDGTHTLLLVRAGSPPGSNKYGPWPHGDGLLGLFVTKTDDPKQVWNLAFLDGYEDYHVEVEHADEKSMVLRVKGAEGTVYRNQMLFDLASKRMLKQYPLPAEAVIPLFDQEGEGFVDFQIAYSKDLGDTHTLLLVGAGRRPDKWWFQPTSEGFSGERLERPIVGLFLMEPGNPGAASKLAILDNWAFKVERSDGSSIVLHFQEEKSPEYKTKLIFDLASKRMLKKWSTPLPVREILLWNDEVYAAVAHPEQTAIVRVDEDRPLVVTGAERNSILSRVKRKSEPEDGGEPLGTGEHRPVAVYESLPGFAGRPMLTGSVDDSLLGLPGSPTPPATEFRRYLPLDSEGRLAVAGTANSQTGRIANPDGIVERIGDEEKLYELPRSTFEQLELLRPEEARSMRSYADKADEFLGESIGPYVIFGDLFWFGKTFYDSEGFTGIGGFGYFDPEEKKFVIYSLPEIVSWSVSALAVNDREVWLGLVGHGAWGDVSGGLLRYERESGRAQRFDLGESNGFEIIDEIKVIRQRGISYVAINNGLFLFQDNRMTRYFFEPMLDGGLNILKNPD